MKLLPNNILKSAGFTLVELLVVIGVLGILAAGLLATVDPLEQFRRASDSNKQQVSLELVNALQRYYATHSAFPWDDTDVGGSALCFAKNAQIIATAGLEASLANGVSDFGPCIDALTNEGELKTSFASQYSLLRFLKVVDTTPVVGGVQTTDRSLRVCYNPDSKNQSRSSGAKTDLTDLTLDTCTGTAGSDCMICTQ